VLARPLAGFYNISSDVVREISLVEDVEWQEPIAVAEVDVEEAVKGGSVTKEPTGDELAENVNRKVGMRVNECRWDSLVEELDEHACEHLALALASETHDVFMR
jgi:hypothetical protein